jgi:hypothetical protein
VFLLFHNAITAFQPLFRTRNTHIPYDIAARVEQVLPIRDETMDHVVQASAVGDGFRVERRIENVPRSDLIDTFFEWDGQYYANVVIVPIALRPVASVWHNLASLLSETNDSILVVRAPMPRTYALMHGRRGSFVNTLKSLAEHLAEKTGLPWRHKALRVRASFNNFVVPETATFVEFENFDWHLHLDP